jgi:putative phosphoesterase
MVIGVVADTHSHPHPGTFAHLREIQPEAILHAGDIGDLGVLDQLREIAPVHAVRGNIDKHQLPDDLTVELGPLRIFMTHIAVYGPHLRADVAKKARAAKANLVVCGHSHVPFISDQKGLTVFNPGSCGPRRLHLPIVFGRIDVGATVKLQHVSAETGQRWLPPG